MSDKRVYLKSNAFAEPLVNQWYAWTYLVAPATSAMLIANAHLKIMKSFIAAPQIHISALKNPAMRGGPFVDYGADKVNDIEALLNRTSTEERHLLEFAEALRTLNKMLAAEAGGSSLEGFYEKVPEALKGYIELVYDLNNHASVRFIEGLLYQSPYYHLSSQSVSLSLGTTTERPYALSTPRLAGEKAVNVRLPFRHEGYDDLFKMRREPETIEYIREKLEIAADDRELFSALFTDEPAAPPSHYKSEGMRIRYFGHACILIETKNTSVLCDPLVSYGFESSESHYTYDDLPKMIDYVLITESHQGHCVIETLLQLRHKIKNVIVPKSNGGALADPSLKLMLQNLGFPNVKEIDEMERIEISNGSITGLPFLGNHGDLNIRSKLAYEIRLQDKSIVCAADSNAIEPKLFERMHDAIGDVDVLFIGMNCDGEPLSWVYGPLLTEPLQRKMDQTRRLNGPNYEQAKAIVERLRPKQIYVYGMGQEPWVSHVMPVQYTTESLPIVESDKLVEDCRQRGLISERLFSGKEILLS